jgi:hypothetical protein
MPQDPVLRAIFEIVERSFPTLFSGVPKEHRFGLRTDVSPSMSPSDEEAVRSALAQDPLLKQFSGTDGHGPFLMTSLAGGWRMEPNQLVPTLIGSAGRELLGRALPTDDLSAFLDVVERHLVSFRALLEGQIVDVLAVTPFEGFALEDGVRVGVPWGTLRPAMPYEKNNQPFGRVEASVVMESWLPFQMKVDESADARVGDATALRDLEAGSTRLVLALLLAHYTGPGSPIADEKWRTIIVPGQRGSSFSGRGLFTRAMPRAEPPILRDDEVHELESWALRVEEAYDPSIRIAVRRLITAIHERMSPEDVLIDSVMVWENLFGHGESSETKFRVTTAIALLLEQDSMQREIVRRELGKIYDARSKVVHGGEVTKKQGLQTMQARAVEVARQCLRELFLKKPALLRERDRGIRLIMGTKEPQGG